MSKLTKEEYIELAEKTTEEWKRNFFLKMAEQAPNKR